jgi:hypothetical protein
MSKNIRSKVVRESLLDYNTLANSLKENTESAVKALLGEAVRDTYAKLLSEDDDKDYEEGEVEDTSSDITNDAESSDVAADDAAIADTEMDAEGGEAVEDEIPAEDGVEASEGEVTDGEGGDEWAEFDKYKVSDDEYDFTNAEDEEIVKVYKLMKNDDQILVHKDDNGNVNIQDNETGAEYLIKLDDEGEAAGVAATEPSDDEVITDDSAEDDFNNDMDDMNESTERMFELVLEYDSNVGYTDNYQKKDVMTNPGMSEPGKNVNDWDAGVPKGDAKPWSGYPSKKNKADKPFNAGKGKQLEEDAVEGAMEEEQIEESAAECGGRMGAHGRMMGTKSHNPQKAKKNSPMNQHHVSTKGEYDQGIANESFIKRANAVLEENKELKSTLTDLMEQLKKVSVTNHNLAQIIKLVSENTTSQDEKKEIINRFKNEGKTIEASKTLYETISRELQKTNKMNITEEKSLTVESSNKINETPIYKSQDMLDSLDLMHRMMR